MLIPRWLIALAFVAGAVPAIAEENATSATFEPFELKPLSGLRFIETVRFGSSLGSLATASEPPDIQIILRRTGESEMSVDGPFVLERIEVSQTTLKSNIPEYDEEWEARHIERWMRLDDGRIRLFHSTDRADRDGGKDMVTDPTKTLTMMSEMTWDMDLVVQLLTTPVLGSILDEGGRPFPADTRQARIRIADWLAPSMQFGISRHGNTAMMRRLASDTALFGIWMEWDSDLSYRGMVEEAGNQYLRFAGHFSGSFSLPGTKMSVNVASIRSMELLIDPASGHEKYRMFDCGIITTVEDVVLKLRNIRERVWTLPDAVAE